MGAFTSQSVTWPRNFRPLPNAFGALFQTLSAEIGTGGVSVGASASTSIYVGTPAARTFEVTSAGFQGPTAAAGGSTITAQLVRNNAGTPVTLGAAVSIKSDVITGDCIDYPLTASVQDRTLNPGDTLHWVTVAAGTVTTQPQLMGTVEIAVVR